MCGENGIGTGLAGAQIGSPPRVRGKRLVDSSFAPFFGITPACAGKTYAQSMHRPRQQDHPRVCGENASNVLILPSLIGSPPRVRGKLSPHSASHSEFRITPACAGKTLRKWRISVVDPSPQPQSSLTSRRADASSGSQRAPCAAPV